MKCYKCKITMRYKEDLEFNGYTLDGWECKKCGEAYYNPKKAQRIF